MSELVGASTYAGLCDNFEDKRLSTSTDFEAFVLRKQKEGHDSCLWWLNECVKAINEEMVSSPMISHRAGGVLALTSIVLGMRDHMYDEVLFIALKICLTLLDDPEGRVRYFACESVFNMVKSARGRCIPEFSNLFDGLCKLTTDPDHDNRLITPIMDRILKEIVMESNDSELAGVESVIEMHLMYPNPFVKQVCIGWISLLRTRRPNIIGARLPNILPSLLSQLSGDNTTGRRDLSVQAFALLSDLLEDLKSLPVVPHTMLRLLRVLVKYANFQDSLSVKARVVVFNWIEQVVLALPDIPSGLADEVVSVTLKTMSSVDTTGVVLTAVTRVNRVCFDRFQSTSVDSFDALIAPNTVLAILDWQGKAQTMLPINVLMTLLDHQPTIPLLVKAFPPEALTAALLSFFRKSADDVENILKRFAEAGLHSLVETIAWEPKCDGPILRRSVWTILGADEFAKYRSLLTPARIDKMVERFTPVCSLTAFTLSLFGRRFDRALKLADTVHATCLDEFATLFETEAFTPHRLALVSNEGKLIAQCLLKIAMIMPDQTASGFKLIMSRLQLVNIFKLL